MVWHNCYTISCRMSTANLYLVNIMKLFLIVLLMLSFQVASQTRQERAVMGLELMSTGKVAGHCKSLQQQLEFQIKHKLKGGGEFIQVFWTAEAKRLKMTVPEFTELCEQAFKKYKHFHMVFVNEKKSLIQAGNDGRDSGIILKTF